MTGVEDMGEEEGMKMLPTDSERCQEPRRDPIWVVSQ